MFFKEGEYYLCIKKREDRRKFGFTDYAFHHKNETLFHFTPDRIYFCHEDNHLIDDYGNLYTNGCCGLMCSFEHINNESSKYTPLLNKHRKLEHIEVSLEPIRVCDKKIIYECKYLIYRTSRFYPLFIYSNLSTAEDLLYTIRKTYKKTREKYIKIKLLKKL